MSRYALLVVVSLSGCSTFPVSMVDHTSDPGRGAPFNNLCDATANFVGAGLGYAHKNNRLYAALGKKWIGQCWTKDQNSLGLKGLWIHEFHP